MFEKITSTPKKVVRHVYNRRGRYFLAAGFVAGGVAVRKLDIDTRAEALAFIEEKGLSNEFFLGE